jgi:hypothetical protein
MAAAEAEAYVDGKWVVAHPAVSAGSQASRDPNEIREKLNKPILDAVPETIVYPESISSSATRSLKALDGWHPSQ